MEEFLRIEAGHNPGKTVFTQKPLDLEYIEIRIGEKMYEVSDHDEWFQGPTGKKGPNGLIFDDAYYLPPDIRPHFAQSRDGENYIRFYFHPYDTSQKQELIKYVEANDIPHSVAKSKTLKAFSTASKSLIAYDTETGRSFSLKTSTTGTVQGASSFEARPYPTRWAYMVRRLSDNFKQQTDRLKSLTVAWEPLMTGFPAVDQSNSVRLMEDVSKGSKTQMSAFVFNDHTEAEAIAKRAGMSHEEFWTEAFKIKGRAMAEMGLYLGFLVTSNHAQNIRWELDNDGKLTGRMVFLDLSDGKPIDVIQKAAGNENFLELWNKYVGNSNPSKSGNTLHFSNFFRGDHNSLINSKWHEIMKQGVVERAAEILQVDQSLIEDSLVSASSPVSWNINMDKSQKLKQALNRHTWNLKKGPPKLDCNRLLRSFL